MSCGKRVYPALAPWRIHVRKPNHDGTASESRHDLLRARGVHKSELTCIYATNR